MAGNYTRGLYRDYELLLTEHEKVSAEHKLLKKKHSILQRESEWQQKLIQEQKAEYKKAILEKDAEIEALKKEILRLNGYLGMDGTNSGIPTSKTPLSRKKVIPNSRKKSGRKVGGQPGHKKAVLEPFKDHEVTETAVHKPDSCPFCGGPAEETGDIVKKDELDYEVVIVKRRHQFPLCKCVECGREFRAPIPKGLKENVQYGSHVKALGLSLMNIGNVSVHKVRKMIYGLSEEGINPSEGYLMKQQRQAAEALGPFMEELRKKCCGLNILYWDDTVIDINKKRGCLRFYGDERHALYRAHLHKDKKGLDDDNILKLLPAETVVMHDHNRVNYNKEYSFSNIECNVHLLRDLQKTTDHLQHKWSGQLKQLLEKTNSERNEAIIREEDAFAPKYINKFFEEFDQIMLLAMEENEKDLDRYYGSDERTLILRILDYKDNYTAWVVNFDLPFSNNLSERALRGVKSKMKVAGQFKNEETAGHYASVKSYIETCYRNGINETEALVRLCEGKPYTVAEIFTSGVKV